MEDFKKAFESLENSGLSIKGVTEIFENETK